LCGWPFLPYWQTLERAKRLLALAEERPQDSDPLLGAAMVLVAVTLDQAVSMCLKTAAFSLENEGKPHLAKRATELMGSSAWMRIKETPGLCSPHPFDLNVKNDYVRYLRDLVDRRNRLLHADEEAAEAVVELNIPVDPESPDAFREAVNKAMVDSSFQAGVRVSEEWAAVTQAEVRRSLSAVELYLDAVIMETATSQSSARKLSLPTG
jgi:hypothetical protein